MSIRMTSAPSALLSCEPAITTFKSTSKTSRSLSVCSAYSSAPPSRDHSPRPSFSPSFDDETSTSQSHNVQHEGYISSRGARYHVYGRGRSPGYSKSDDEEGCERQGIVTVQEKGMILLVTTEPMVKEEQEARGLAVVVKERGGRERNPAREREYRY